MAVIFTSENSRLVGRTSGVEGQTCGVGVEADPIFVLQGSTFETVGIYIYII